MMRHGPRVSPITAGGARGQNRMFATPYLYSGRLRLRYTRAIRPVMIHRLLQLALLLDLLLAPAGLLSQSAPARAASIAGTTGDPDSTFSLETDREPVASLIGQWRFQPGDDPRWASPAFDDSRWALVKSAEDWNENGFGFHDGTAWYRFRVTLPAGDEPYALLLPTIYTCYQVFADGNLLLTEGKLPPNPSTFLTRPTLVELSQDPRPAAQTILIALRIWNDPTWSRNHHGGLQGEAFVGRSDVLRDRFTTEQQAHMWQFSDELSLGALDLLAFGVALALFLGRRSERELLWFALLTGAQAVVHCLEAWSHLQANNLIVFRLAEAAFGTLFLVAALQFFRTLLGGKQTNAFLFALICCGLYGLTAPLSWVEAISFTEQSFFKLVFLLPVYFWIVLFVAKQAGQRQPDARILRFPVAILFASFAYSRLIAALETMGMTALGGLQVRWRTPVYLTLDDVAECFFLIAVLVIVLRRVARRSREQDRVHSELEAARSVQQVLVPESLPRIEGLSIGTAYHPAQEVGGDFFQILSLPSSSVLIIVGDVAGKGLPAALLVSLVVGTLRALAEWTDSPAQILAGLNRSLQGRGQGFTTCLAMSISPDRTVLTFANAGHIAPYVNGFELRTEPNLPLGLVPASEYDEVHYTLQAGDHLTVLTDGVPEAMHHRELFGFERTVMISRQPAGQIAEAARTFGQTDDITVLTIDVVAIPASHTEQLLPALQPA